MKIFSYKHFNSKKNICLYTLLFVVTFILYSCARQPVFFNVGVDSIVDPTMPEKKNYFLYPADSTISADDLHFKEYSNYIKSVLNQQGYKYTPYTDSAEIIVLVRYGLGEPVRNDYSYSVPIFGRTDKGDATVTSSSSTYGSVGNTSVSGNTTTTTKVKSKPTYGVVGSNTYSGSYTTYLRYLSMEALDVQSYKESGSVNSLWQTTITSVGSSNDLRYVMPAMIAASSEYIGKNTKQRIDLEIKENDPRILNLKGISTKK